MLTKWDSAFLIMLVLPVMGHVIVLPMMLDVAGRDAWISVLISFPFAIVYAYLIFRLKMQNPDSHFRDIARSLLGKPVGLVLQVFFSLYFLFLSVLSVVKVVDMINIGFLPETPGTVLVIWFLVFCLYAARKGIKSIALTSAILCIFAIAIGYTVSITSSRMKDWGNLQPVLEYGWPPVLVGALVLLNIWVELVFLLMVSIQNIRQEKFIFRFWVACIVWNSIIMIAAMTGTVMVFGLGQARNLQYPALEIVRLISLGFIDRLDLYAMLLMSIGCYIRTSLYLRLAYDLSLPAHPTWLHRMWLYGLWAGVLACSLYIGTDQIRLNILSSVDVYGVVLFPLMAIMSCISWFKNGRSRWVET